MQEVKARGGRLYVFADSDTHIVAEDGIHVIRMPEHYGALSPILHTVPLQLLAYQSDLTRVITFMYGREQTGRPYPQIGVPEPHHPVTHHQADPVKMEKCTRIQRYHIQLFTEYLEKLRNTPDGQRQLIRRYTLHPATAEFVTSHEEVDAEQRQAAHRRIGRRPEFMADLMLMLDGRARLRARTLRAMAARPSLFAGMLAMHVGELSPLGFFTNGLALGWPGEPDDLFVNDDGSPRPDADIRAELGMVQVLGRLALSAGILAVAGVSGWVASFMSREEVFLIGLIVPLISITGAFIRRKTPAERRALDWRILGGGLTFGATVIALAKSASSRAVHPSLLTSSVHAMPSCESVKVMKTLML